MFKKVFYNTTAQVAGKALTAGTTLIVTIIIGRSLGEAGYGDFTKIFTFVGYFYTFADFGLNAIFIKNANDKKEQYLFRVLLGLRLLISISLVFIAIVVGNLLPYEEQTKIGFSPLVKIGITLASLTILTHALFTSANAIFQRKLRYDLSTIGAVFGAVTVLVAASAFAVLGLGLIGFSSIYVVGGAVTFLVAAFLIHRFFKLQLAPVFAKEEFKSFLKQSWPIGVALILNLIYFRIDVFILSITRQSAEVGLYGLAYQFFEASLAVPIFFSNALYPLLIKLKNDDPNVYKKQVLKWLRILTLISLTQAAALFVISFLIPFLYQGRFSGSVQALQVLSIGVPFFFLSALLWHCIIIVGRQKHLVFIYGAGAVFNLVSNLIFIPQYGFIAAAVVTVISEALIFALLAIDYFSSRLTIYDER